MTGLQEYALLSDEALIQRFRNGDAAGSFTAIVERYQRRIYAAALQLSNGDHDLADDFAQETFVKAYSAIGRFRGESQLYTWLYRILVNLFIQHRRRTGTSRRVALDDVANVVESKDAQPVEVLQQQQTRRLIEEAIKRLPPKQRTVFLMRFYEELPYEEIAKVTGTSVGGLKANYFHALKKVSQYVRAVEGHGLSGRAIGTDEIGLGEA